MENSTNPKSSSSSSSSASSPVINGSLHQHIITRSSDHYHPTTFVQTDASSFKQVVQMLTGNSSTRSSDSLRPPPTPSGKGNFVIPPIKTAQPKKHSGNKLYDRRSLGGFNNNLKNSLMIDTLMIGGGAGSQRFSPRNQNMMTPSCLDFPKLAFASPVTPLKQGNDGDPFDRMSPLSEEERAIAEKGYYLHNSPIATPREAKPQLLDLFPVTPSRLSPEK